jgi:methyl-accepting chemotaxis protein
MKSRLWLKVFGASFVILLLAGAAGYFSVSQLKRNAELIVDDTLPGLSFGGAANAYLADASRTLLLIVTDDPDRRREIRQEMETLSRRTTGYLEQYKKFIFEPGDKANYETLLKERSDYIQIREQVVALALAGKRNEALALYNDTMVPAHKRVKEAGDKLFEYNMRQGEARGRKIMGICTVTQIAVAVVCVVVFIAGFFIGLFK